MTGKTLKELNVKPGDVVRYIPLGGISTITHIKEGKYYGDGSHRNNPYSDDLDYEVVSRATPTRADLIAQRDAKAAEVAALDAEINAMPETVRVWGGLYAGKWLFSDASFIHDSHYRDFTLINGVPEGFTKVEGV